MLKAKYAVNYKNDYRVITETLGNAIFNEIIDELGLRDDGLTQKDYEDTLGLTSKDTVEGIMAVYHDLVECGKPQFLFVVKLRNMESAHIKKIFDKKNAEKSARKSKNKQSATERDGKQMLFFSLDELKNAKISAGAMEIDVNGKKQSFAMMQSASASMVILLEYLNGR